MNIERIAELVKELSLEVHEHPGGMIALLRTTGLLTRQNAGLVSEAIYGKVEFGEPDQKGDTPEEIEP